MKTLHTTEKRTSVLLSIAALSAFVLTGCGTGPNRDVVTKAWTVGDVKSASAELKRQADDKTLTESGDLLWILDGGVVSGLEGDYAESDRFLALGADVINNGFRQEEEKDFLSSLASAAKSLVSADPYEARMQESVKVPTLRVYNALGQGDKKLVFVRVKELENACGEAGEICGKRLHEQLEAAQKSREFAAGDKNGTYDPVKETQEDDALTAQLKEIYGEDYVPDYAAGNAMSAYVNPFSYWLCSAVCLNAAEEKEDFERAKFALKTACEINRTSEIFSEELDLADRAGQCESVDAAKASVLKNHANVTYVIYEGGLAPSVGAKPVKMKVPAAVSAVANAVSVAAGGGIIPSEGTVYLPVVDSSGEPPALNVAGGSRERVFDADDALAKALRDEAAANALNAKIALSATVITRAASVLATRLAKDAAEKKDADAWVKAAATAAYTAARLLTTTDIELSKPDSRTWKFLPRTIDLVKMPTPASGEIEISGEKVAVPAQGVNFVRVRKVDEYWPAVVQVFPLDAEKSAAGQSVVPVKRLSAPARPGTPEAGAPATVAAE